MTDGRPFVVTVEGIPRDDGTWVIEATVTFAPGTDRDALKGEARAELLLGIVREGLKCRRAGATIAEVILDEGDGPQVVPPSQVGIK